MKLPVSAISKLALAGLVILGAAGVWLVSNVDVIAKFSTGGPDDEEEDEVE